MFNLSKHHVAAGSYHVTNAQPLILQAFLGTCVGVALYDRENGIGGLMHILLPEPVASEGSLFPEKYATTGMPLFLNAITEAGAAMENLSAIVAGGALVGPIDQRDLMLDIGGRSEEIVRRLLAAEGIRIEKSETGGFFACSLNLNMKTGNCQIEPAGFEFYSETQDVSQPSKDQIYDAMETLKPIPQVALKIIRLIGEDDYDIAEIANEVRKDQVISAKTLQLSNSALFSVRERIDTLDHALLLVGQDQLLKLVISASVRRLFEPATQGYSLCKGGLFHHALGTALITEKLARIHGRIHPALAYTAGLLHDIGKVVLDQYVTSAYPLFYRDLIETGRNFLESEQKILGFDHTQVGHELAIKWEFPESLAFAIRDHHVPENTPKDNTLVHTLYLADYLMSRFNTGLELERMNTDHFEQRLQTMGFTASKLIEIIDAIPEKFFAASPEIMLEG
ncbi:MAG: HDOD domain-containing protein [Deltaproteobacteria bacterium]|nr:HDOD domain-containing protein [Deltaproteobacteria bacterium]